MIGFVAGFLRIVSYLLVFHAGLVIGHGGANAGVGPIWSLVIAVFMGSIASVIGAISEREK